MDSNNPNSGTPSSNPQIPDPNSGAAPVSPWGAPTTLPTPGAPSDEVISDIPQIPPPASSGVSSFTTTPPEIPAVDPSSVPAAPNSWEQSPSSEQAATSPWENTLPLTPSSVGAPSPIPDPMNTAQPGTGVPQSAWSNPASAAPTQTPTTTTQTANPFLQPHDGGFSIPSPSNPSQVSAVPQPRQEQIPIQPPGAVDALPNPMAINTPDPMNTAFNPTAAPPNPFSTQAPTDPPNLGANAPQDQPGNTLDSPPQEQVPTGLTEPVQGFINTSEPNLGSGQPGQSAGEAIVQDQAIPQATQPGALDLSSLQNGQAIPPGNNENPLQTPTSPSPAPVPTENAPTDLSHLIAGEEAQPPQPMGNVYTPPVAPDQPMGNVPQTTAATESGSAEPTEKHLNLTKVLLVAGIPIILIVAALSAYLILGVGRAAPEEDTSLPVEQTTQDQAPLTNPPQQIVAPSPQTIPDPVTSLPAPPTSAETLPAPSVGTSAMDRLRAQQSASPAAASSPAPASSASESLPLN